MRTAENLYAEWDALNARVNNVTIFPFGPDYYGVDPAKNPEYDGIRAVGTNIHWYGLFLSYLGFAVCMWAMNGIYKGVYAGKNKRFVKYFTMDHFYDLSLFVIWLTYIIVTYAHDLRGTWIDRTPYLYNRDEFIY